MVKKSVRGLFLLSLLVIFGILAAGCIGAKETPAPTTAAPTTQPPMTTPPPPSYTTAPPTPAPTTAAPVVTAPPAPLKPVAIEVLDYPKSMGRDDYNTIKWKVTGGDTGKIEETRVVWALAKVANVSNLSTYKYLGKIYKGQTTATFMGDIRSPNCGTGASFFRVYAKVDGKDYFSKEYAIDGYPSFGSAGVDAACPTVIDLQTGIIGTGPVKK
ncbi:MAG: hypothetical protein AABX40_03660 [Candidatus Hydrothermarchaeota archaeon]